MTASGDKGAGLCANCLHVRVIRSDRGATFYLCQLSATDPRFPKYPRLPVLSCSGYEEDKKPATGKD
jgi:hypothetical protein